MENKITAFRLRAGNLWYTGSYQQASSDNDTNRRTENMDSRDFWEQDLPERLKQLWGSRRPGRLDGELLKRAAVLVPLLWKDGCYQLLFEVRAGTLSSQPGEICFPGGGLEAGESGRQAAVRETMEELLLLEKQIELLAPLDVLETPAGVEITPYLGLLSDYQGSFSAEEVDRVFTIPLDSLLEIEPERHVARVCTVPASDFPFEKLPGQEQYHFREGTYPILFYETEHGVIWGMTAKILHSFLQMYQENASK